MCVSVRIFTRQVFFYSQKSKFVSGNLGTNSEDFHAYHHRLYTLCHLHDLALKKLISYILSGSAL